MQIARERSPFSHRIIIPVPVFRLQDEEKAVKQSLKKIQVDLQCAQTLDMTEKSERPLAPGQGATLNDRFRLVGMEDGSPDIILELSKGAILEGMHKLRNAGAIDIVGTHWDDEEDLRTNYQFALFPHTFPAGYVPQTTRQRRQLEDLEGGVPSQVDASMAGSGMSMGSTDTTADQVYGLTRSLTPRDRKSLVLRLLQED